LVRQADLNDPERIAYAIVRAGGPAQPVLTGQRRQFVGREWRLADGVQVAVSSPQRDDLAEFFVVAPPQRHRCRMNAAVCGSRLV
jgi:hypothetical protein